MKRRDFLKLLSVAPIAPSVLAAMPKKHLTLEMVRKVAKELEQADKKNTVTISGTENLDGEYYLFLPGQHLVDPTHIWAKEMARLHNEAIDKMIIECLV